MRFGKYAALAAAGSVAVGGLFMAAVGYRGSPTKRGDTEIVKVDQRAHGAYLKLGGGTEGMGVFFNEQRLKEEAAYMASKKCADVNDGLPDRGSWCNSEGQTYQKALAALKR